MYEKSRMKTGSEGRRLETRKHQREAKGQFHPRSLARSVAHKRMENAEIGRINKVIPGGTQSPFAQSWRRNAEQVAR